MNRPITERQRIMERKDALWRIRRPYEDLWSAVAKVFLPFNLRLRPEDQDKPVYNYGLYSSKPTIHLRTFVSGLMAGRSNPAKMWHQLKPYDPEMADYRPVREWLSIANARIEDAFQRSNFYTCLPAVYQHQGVAGISALHIDEDEDEIIRGYVWPLGSYAIATNARGEADTLYRQTQMTVGAMVRKFGYDRCSQPVKSLYDRNRFDDKVNLVHVVEPRQNFLAGTIGPRGMKWRSVWIEEAGNGQKREGEFLGDFGYEERPFVVPRWWVEGGDAYSSSPAIEALAVARALQKNEKQGIQIGDLTVSPPRAIPESIRRQTNGAPLLPGDDIYIPDRMQGLKVEPIYQVHPNALMQIDARAARFEDAVADCMYAKLFLLLATTQDTDKTAYEVAELHEERLLQLTPPLMRQDDELFDPAIDRTFGALLRGGHLPPPPPELMGQPLRVEYTSVLNQAQKLIGVTQIERFVGFIGGVAKQAPEIADKIDMDAAAEEYADSLGIPTRIVRSAEDTQQRRAARAQAMAAQQQAEQAVQQTQAIRNLGSARMGDDTALADLANQMGGSAPTQGAA
jgi:hypothetical protein